MPKIRYQEISFKDSSLVVIAQANEIIEQYRRQGFVLTLRQLYYQFVARALIPNTQQSYKRLGGIVNDGRMGVEIKPKEFGFAWGYGVLATWENLVTIERYEPGVEEAVEIVKRRAAEAEARCA